MSESNHLAIPEPIRANADVGFRGVEIKNMDEMSRFCQAVANSKLAPRGIETPQAIMVAVQCGLELGLSPMQAVQSIAVINGRPSLWGDACLALCMGRADFVDCIETIDADGEKMEAACVIKRKGRADLTRRFSVADAKRAGLWGKTGPWTQYPKRMLQIRARSWAIRDAFPDALKGIGVAEEVRDTPRREAAPVPALELPGEPLPQLDAPAAESEPLALEQ